MNSGERPRSTATRAATTGPTATASSWPAAAFGRGITYGSSDKLGAYPDSDAVSPGDLAATLFWRFGLDPVQEMVDLTGRPYTLADRPADHRTLRMMPSIRADGVPCPDFSARLLDRRHDLVFFPAISILPAQCEWHQSHSIHNSFLLKLLHRVGFHHSYPSRPNALKESMFPRIERCDLPIERIVKASVET